MLSSKYIIPLYRKYLIKIYKDNNIYVIYYILKFNHKLKIKKHLK